MKFKNRDEAGQILAVRLRKYKDPNTIVLAIPRGGVPIGYIVAKSLNAPLDLVLSKKIGHPTHKEYAIGAVTLNNRVLSEAAKYISSEYIDLETAKIREKLKNKFKEYYGDKKPLKLQDKIIIIVDDGIATGNTILSTIEMLYEEKPQKIVVAIPVTSSSALMKLESSSLIDEVVCLLLPEYFRAVGQFYEDFDQVTDEEVKKLLIKANLNLTAN